MWLFAHPALSLPVPPAHCFSLGCEGPDQADPDGTHGHWADEGTWKRPRDAGGPAIQPGQILHQHPGAAQNLAG